MIMQAVEVENHDLLNQYSEHRTHDGKPGVVRNGYLPEREIADGRGAGDAHPLAEETWSKPTGQGHPFMNKLRSYNGYNINFRTVR